MADSNNALADAFNAIDDPQTRIASLTNLVQALSPWERRHVRIQLEERNGLSGFEDLPADIVCNLIPFLKIEDVLACAATSKRCRTTWTEPSVAIRLCLHFFPALQPPFTFSAFCEVSKQYFIRRAGEFAIRLSMSLPFSRSNDTLAGLLFSQNLQQWDQDSRLALRPDPVLHPGGGYPAGWLEMLNAKFACYGGGNVVWFALPDFFVIDNMYKRMRRAIRVPGGVTPGWMAASSKALVALRDNSRNKLFIYDIETNKSSRYQLPSDVRSMIVRDRRIFLVLYGMQVCVLDHDGSRVLTKHHFKANEGFELFRGFFTDNGTVVIFPHPHDPDRFFVAIKGWLNRDPRSEDEDLSEGDSGMSEPTNYLIVREFVGSLHIATYKDPWLSCPVMDEDICFSTEAEALDDQGTYAAGHWSIEGTDDKGLKAAGLPPPPKGFSRYNFQTSFNTITKEFGIQRHVVPETIRAGRCSAPWGHQDFFPYVQEPGVLKIRRFDADDADFYPSRPSRPKSKGERADFLRDWTVTSPMIDEVTEQTCRFFHDKDFTIMFLEESHLVHVWGYVDDEEAWAEARPSSAPQEMRQAMGLD